MQVKTFEAMSIKDAIKAVKSEFGPEAVILNTRRKSINGENASVVEVTAAVPERRTIGASVSSAPSTHLAASTEITEKLQALESRVSALVESVPNRVRFQAVESGIEEIKMLLVEALRSKAGSLLENIPEHLVRIEQQLRAMGVDPAHVAALLKHLSSLPPPESNQSVPENRDEYYRAHALRWMFKRIQIAPRWNLVPGTTQIHVLVGPTGVGKTAMAAKLAAHYHLKEKAKVLLVSFDNHRLAAAEQLRVYSRVIGVPFDVMTRADELPAILQKHPVVDLVLIDTAGRSPKSSSLSQDIESFNAMQVPIDKHLVLSITEKEQQLDRAVRQFAPLGIQSLIFNKLDESWSYGEIFNLSAKWSVPLSYFGVGQRIPEDLERASRERVVERIIGV